MFSRRLHARRWGRSASRDFVLMLLILFVFMVAVMRWLGPEDSPDTRSLGHRIFTIILGFVQCFGLIVGVGFLLALFELFKRYLAQSHARLMEDKLAGIIPLTQDARQGSSSNNLAVVLHHLDDPNF